jgi:valyl-tRNA synthetase
VRSLRKEHNLSKDVQLDIIIATSDPTLKQLLSESTQDIVSQSKTNSMILVHPQTTVSGAIACHTQPAYTLYLTAQGGVQTNTATELDKLQKKLAKLQESIQGITDRMKSDQYMKVPAKVQEKERYVNIKYFTQLHLHCLYFLH